MQGSRMSMKCRPVFAKSPTLHKSQPCGDRFIEATTPTSARACSSGKETISTSVASSTMCTAQAAASASLPPPLAQTTRTSTEISSGAASRFSHVKPLQRPRNPAKAGRPSGLWSSVGAEERFSSWIAPTMRPAPVTAKTCKDTSTFVSPWSQETHAPYLWLLMRQLPPGDAELPYGAPVEVLGVSVLSGDIGGDRAAVEGAESRLGLIISDLSRRGDGPPTVASTTIEPLSFCAQPAAAAVIFLSCISCNFAQRCSRMRSCRSHSSTLFRCFAEHASKSSGSFCMRTLSTSNVLVCTPPCQCCVALS
mmetsp:Transcript_119057/g.342094  ORF Transcript_119057/g.342094 Transcript_119057/m.342094 type:complete len:308 (-) Transcript_119057:1280-2203(-)